MNMNLNLQIHLLEKKKIRKSRSKKIYLSDEEVQPEEKIAKPKRECTQKQKEAFQKAREK